MSEAREFKKQQIDAIKKTIQESKSFVIVEYSGINVEQDTKLRASCRQNGIEYKVLKNRLLKIALNELGYNQFDGVLENTTAVAFAKNDALDAAKVITNSSKEIKALQTKCGMLDGKFVDANTVTVLASIPSKEILLSQLLGLLQSGLSGLARAIAQIAEQKA